MPCFVGEHLVTTLSSVFHQRHIETMHKIIFSNPADFDPIIDDMCHELDIVYGLYERILDLKKEIVAPNNSGK